MFGKVFLTENEIPRKWYNILADIKMNPPLDSNGKPIKLEDLAPFFPMNLIEQEVSTRRWIDIPEDVLKVLCIWRPSPLVRALSLKRHWVPLPEYISKTKASVLPEVTSRIPPSLKHTTIKFSVLSG
jgi:predicted alternative tryptophan synthase beta-subunit